MYIYAAGIENSKSELWANGLQPGQCSNAFWSYFYGGSSAKTGWLKEVSRGVERLIVDSGAHSFFTSNAPELSATGRQQKEERKRDPDQYFAQYLEWLMGVNEFISYFVELDIGELVGQGKVMEWREILKKRGLWEKCITVYHPKIMTMDDYLSDLKESGSRYVALEGDRGYRARLDYLPLIRAAYDTGVRVHGFALCKQEVLAKYPFYSIDSVTWKSGPMYGRNIGWRKGRIQTLLMKRSGPKAGTQARCRGRLFSEILEGRSVSGILANDTSKRASRLLYALMSFDMMEEHYTELWKSRGVNWEAQINACS